MEIKSPDIVFENLEKTPFYINGISIISTYFDFLFICGNNSINPIDKKIVNKETIRIIMSPQHAKVLSSLLQDQITKYESEFGELKVPNIQDLDKK